MPIYATVSGFLGKDPETRQVSNSSVTEFSVASSDGFGDRKSTTWVRVQVWGRAGEAAREQLSKGNGVVCHGRLVSREYESGGQKRQSLDLQNATWDYPPTRKEDGGGQQSRSGSGRGSSGGRGRQGADYSDDDLPF